MTMGLEGANLNNTMCIGALQKDMLMQFPIEMGKSTTLSTGQFGDNDSFQLPLELIIQAQALLRKNALYEEINAALQKSKVFQPNAQNLLAEDENRVTCLHRDAAVNNLKFLNVFYGYGHSTFFLAVNLLDRLLGKVKANVKYLSCIATSCFYTAVKQTQENHVFIPDVEELVKLSQCGGNADDLHRMENLILEKLNWQINAVTPFTFVDLFYQMFMDKEDDKVWRTLVSSVEILSCHFDLATFRMETVALALVSYVMQEMGFLNSMQKFNSIVEMQFYCQIADEEILKCRQLIIEYLEMYANMATKLPRLQLNWTVSKRTLNKMKPSTKVLSDLEPIMEDEDDNGYNVTDAGPFDSENDESELEKQIRSMRLKSNPAGHSGISQQCAASAAINIFKIN